MLDPSNVSGGRGRQLLLLVAVRWLDVTVLLCVGKTTSHGGWESVFVVDHLLTGLYWYNSTS